jgi:hypothetical protein
MVSRPAPIHSSAASWEIPFVRRSQMLRPDARKDSSGERLMCQLLPPLSVIVRTSSPGHRPQNSATRTRASPIDRGRDVT